uniref:MD-2-related lipid-recognition domain-containing protein n=1 Tax=Anopheles minimus TaxID=112268 RepID=A0A182WEZ6_9DIPT
MEFLNRLTKCFIISVALTSVLKDTPTDASSYSIKVKKYVCIDTPYEETKLLSCKSIPRRNAPTMVLLTLYVPKLYDHILVKVMLFFKFSTYQPFLITISREACEVIRHPPQFGIERHVYDIIEETLPEIITPCPIGNRTFNVTWYLHDRHAPKNIPAGEFKLQFQALAQPNVTLFALDVYFVVRNGGIISFTKP